MAWSELSVDTVASEFNACVDCFKNAAPVTHQQITRPKLQAMLADFYLERHPSDPNLNDLRRTHRLYAFDPGGGITIALMFSKTLKRNPSNRSTRADSDWAVPTRRDWYITVGFARGQTVANVYTPVRTQCQWFMQRMLSESPDGNLDRLCLYEDWNTPDNSATMAIDQLYKTFEAEITAQTIRARRLAREPGYPPFGFDLRRIVIDEII